MVAPHPTCRHRNVTCINSPSSSTNSFSPIAASPPLDLDKRFLGNVNVLGDLRSKSLVVLAQHICTFARQQLKCIFPATFLNGLQSYNVNIFPDRRRDLRKFHCFVNVINRGIKLERCILLSAMKSKLSRGRTGSNASEVMMHLNILLLHLKYLRPKRVVECLVDIK